MRILLIRPGARKRIDKIIDKQNSSDYLPLGVALIASYLEKHGINVEIFDNNTACLDRYELYEYLKKKQGKFDVYGISAIATQYTYVKHLSVILKELTGRTLILGGPLATYSPELVLKNSAIDFCVIGEGQETMLDLLSNLKTPQHVKGICFRNGDGLPYRTAPRILREHLDDYPLPAYHLFDMNFYLKSGLRTMKANSSLVIPNLYTGIGCPYRCRFCTKTIATFRLRSVDSVIDEVRYLKKTFSINGVNFCDDLLVISKKRVMQFCDKMKGLNLLFSGQARANTVDEEIIEMLKKSGCVSYGIGVESGSDKILRMMRKGTTREQNKRALVLGKKFNINVKVQLLFGFPGEDNETVEETLALFRETGYPPRRFNLLTPLPGSAVYDDCVSLRIIKDENIYLDKISKLDAGFSTKKLFINLTEWSDKEYMDQFKYAEDEMRKMMGTTEKHSNGSDGIFKKIALKIKNSSRLKNLMEGRLTKKFNPEEHYDRYLNLAPLLNDRNPTLAKEETYSWQDIKAEKIKALIEKYTSETSSDKRGSKISDNFNDNA